MASAAVKERWSKAQIIDEVAESTGLSKRDVGNVLDELGTAIHRHLQEDAVGEFVLPSLLKIQKIKKKAREERQGRNPFTGETITIAAKPASWGVKISALKKLRDMVE